ncbi:MAG: gliding motility-associated C-terminal domain-containing protein, partial [Bacteroidota bacterium]
FAINIDSISSTTHGLYYSFSRYEYGSVLNINDEPDSLRANTLWDEYDIENPYNPSDSVETIIYQIHPYISIKNCPGSDTTIIIKVNPEPRMDVSQSDTAVCFDWGYSLPMSSEISSTTGQLQYSLMTEGYDVGAVSGVPNNYFSDIVNLGQDSVINNGDSIEDVTYLFTPFIENARSSGHCYGVVKEPVIVRVAPELKGFLEADTAIGGWEIWCNGDLSDTIHSNIEGGFYEQPYDFNWDTDGGSYGSLDQNDSIQYDLTIGKYWFTAEDVLGCGPVTDTLEIEEPPPYSVEVDITEPATCEDWSGAIDITPSGSTPAYEYYWRSIGWDATTQDLLNIPSGPYELLITDVNGCTYDSSYEVHTVDQIRITYHQKEFNRFKVTCYGENTGEISVSQIEGGFPGYTLNLYNEEDVIDLYEIETSPNVYSEILNTPGPYSTTIQNLPSGNYFLVAFDDVGCPNVYYNDTIIIDEPDPISITKVNAPYYDTVDISCFGAGDGAIDIQVTGGHTDYLDNEFQWWGPDPDLNLTDSIQVDSTLGPGLYTVKVTDPHGCTDTAQFTLIEPDEIVLDAAILSDTNSWNITCYGESDGFIDIESSGGISTHHYAWESDQMVFADPSAQDQQNMVAGTYYLTITDDINCVRRDTFRLRQPNPLVVEPLITDINGWQIACAGDSSGAISLTPFGGADSTQNLYEWSSVGGYIENPASMDQEDLSAGTYTVHVTDISGCELDSIFIMQDPPPIVIDNLSSDSAYCAGSSSGSIDLDAHGGHGEFTYSWISGGATVGNTSDLDSIPAGVYILTLTDENGCMVEDSIAVFEADWFEVNVLVGSDYNGVPVSCAGYSDGIILMDTANLGGKGPYTFAWSNGGSTQDLDGVPAGVYRVVVTDYYGCVDSTEVEIGEPDPISYTLQDEDPLCYHDSTGRINLLLTGGTVFGVSDYEVWLNGKLSGPFTGNLPAGTYAIRMEDLNDCFVETETELVDPPLLELEFDTENAFCKDKPDGELSLYVEGGTPPYNILWDRGLYENENYFNEVYWGEYVATVTDFNNCVTIDTAFVDYTYASCLVIPNAFSPNSDGFNDLWVIEGLELYSNVELRIFDRWGSQVFYTSFAEGDLWDGSFNGRHLPIDSYHYIIDLNNDEPPITGNITIVR